MRGGRTSCLALLFSVALVAQVSAGDWAQFRGPGGSGVSSDADVPLEWSDSSNIQWKTDLPGPGASSPIVFKDRVYLTCYSGYGIDRSNPGNIEDLKRHLLCIDREDGKVIWTKTVDAVQPEDPYSGMGVPEHGYASNTPATDGERIYAFFGKSGVLAFDMDGNQLWQVSVGTESSSRRWGSSASLILHKETVIVNASEESQSVRALDKKTGKEIWKAQASGLTMAYCTPLLIETDNGTEVVVPVPYEVWSLNADTGKLAWFAEYDMDGNMSPSPIAADGVVYILGGYRTNGSLAIRAGGKDGVTDSHVLWTSSDTSYIPSPVFHNGHLYWVSDQGIAHCMKADTGENVYRERLSVSSSGRGKPFYASVTLAGDRLIAVSRTGGTFILAAKPQFAQLAHNTIASDDTNFNASAALSNGQMFLRSDRAVYCIAAP